MLPKKNVPIRSLPGRVLSEIVHVSPNQDTMWTPRRDGGLIDTVSPVTTPYHNNLILRTVFDQSSFPNFTGTGGAHKVLTQFVAGGPITVAQLQFSDIAGVLVVAQIPALPASQITSGLISLVRGGTGTDLSGTGGASFVLRQSSIGATITVSQLAASDLSNGTSGSGAVLLANAPTFTGNPVFASSTGSGAVVLATSPTFVTGLTTPGAILTAAAPTVAASQIGLGGTTAATATAGAGTLPATPVAFIVVNIAGTNFKIPYYNV